MRCAQVGMGYPYRRRLDRCEATLIFDLENDIGIF